MILLIKSPPRWLDSACKCTLKADYQWLQRSHGCDVDWISISFLQLNRSTLIRQSVLILRSQTDCSTIKVASSFSWMFKEIFKETIIVYYPIQREGLWLFYFWWLAMRSLENTSLALRSWLPCASNSLDMELNVLISFFVITEYVLVVLE